MIFKRVSRMIWEPDCGKYSIAKLPTNTDGAFEYKAFHGVGFNQIGGVFKKSTDAKAACEQHEGER